MDSSNGEGASNRSGKPNPNKEKCPEAGPSSKRKRLNLKELQMNEKLLDPEMMGKLTKAWMNRIELNEPDLVNMSSFPFAHTEIFNFVDDNKELMDALFATLDDGTIFHEKASDLFQFQQSDDVKSISLDEVAAIRGFFEGPVLKFVTQLTGFPLNGTVDMFFSNYQQNDFLLCHDDELESRRIAFIWYLSPEWKPEYGGSLDLFDSKEVPQLEPTSIVKSVIPSFNKFVFFDVNSKSFHQVGEVTEDRVERFALSGWFYGEPVPRPSIVLPSVQTYSLKDHTTKIQNALKEYLTEVFAEPSNYESINEQLESDSQLLLSEFLKPEVYETICKDLDSCEWDGVGPPNICSFGESTCRVWPNTSPDVEESGIETLSKFFHSEDFLQFLEQITEFPFSSADSTLVSSQLRRYGQKSYELLRERGSDSTKDRKACGPGCSNADDDEVEEEPTLVDLIYYCGDFVWEEGFGGLTIYNDELGEQLITVTPQPNSLAVIVRSPSVASFVNYVNSLAGDAVFHAYRMTFDFTGIPAAK